MFKPLVAVLALLILIQPSSAESVTDGFKHRQSIFSKKKPTKSYKRKARKRKQYRARKSTRKRSSGSIKTRCARIDSLIVSNAQKQGVPIRLARAVVRHESGCRSDRRGKAGEWGAMQIFCRTARGIGFRGPCSSLRQNHVNIRWGMKYLGLAYKKTGTLLGAATLYNAGIYSKRRSSKYGRAVVRKL